MKPKILVLYYTQTGQLRRILDSITSQFARNADIDHVQIEPEISFPFPWTALQFFDAMPETVVHLPTPIKPMNADMLNKEYDLIIFGYQPWFLNPSQPTTAFLKSKYIEVFRNRPVITVVGSRNMWLHAQEKVKGYLNNVNARLVGNIVLKDTNTNLISLLTVIRWSFKGQKEASGLLPAAGVQDRDIEGANRFGPIIYQHLKDNDLISLHHDLLRSGSVDLKPGLVLLEQRGIKNFRYWAAYIREKGGPADPNRADRVIMFKNLLLVGIFVLSPILSLSALVKQIANRSKLLRDVAYFKQLQYEEGRI